MKLPNDIKQAITQELLDELHEGLIHFCLNCNADITAKEMFCSKQCIQEDLKRTKKMENKQKAKIIIKTIDYIEELAQKKSEESIYSIALRDRRKLALQLINHIRFDDYILAIADDLYLSHENNYKYIKFALIEKVNLLDQICNDYIIWYNDMYNTLKELRKCKQCKDARFGCEECV